MVDPGSAIGGFRACVN